MVKILKHENKAGLVFAGLSIGSFLISLVFTSLNITGYFVLQSEEGNMLSFGVLFFFLGLIFSFLYFSEKRRIKKEGKKIRRW